ncbi:uncharacterized protein LOC119071722 [Bradysia coprophila]|uniref:uncharacterized protein LOC119071722 n=1 Tax=Bradysia coprophila TaxID=38358 RepID=UPI00187D908C|nr:uncharacterized protein LOC119071722 [Bradysia coprophila]
MNIEEVRPHMDELNKSMANVEKMLARNVDTFASITEEFVADIQIVLRDMILPGHKYVISFRCDALAKIISTGVDELDWTSYESSIGIVLLRWFYTNEVVSDNDSVTLGVLRAAHNLALPTLFAACESKLLTAINEDCSREFYKIAREVNAKMLMDKCTEWRSTFDDDSSGEQDIQIDKEDDLKTPSLIDVDLEKFESPRLKPLRDELMDLLRRKRKIDEDCSKLGKSLVGIKEYMDFFDTTIWTWPAHNYILISRSEKLQALASNFWSGLKKRDELVLVRWIYTNHVHIDSIDIALTLLEASYKYDLHTLFGICEEAVIRMISIGTCAQVHYIAVKVSAKRALIVCERITAQYLDCIKSELNEAAVGANKSKDPEGTICEFPPQKADSEAGILLSLNDDCLLHLLRFIPLVDLGSVKDTCRRLSELADRSFQLYGDKTLTIRRGSMVADLWTLKHFGKLINSLVLESLYQPYCSCADLLAMIGLFANERLKSISLCLNYDKSVTMDDVKCLEKIVKNVNVIVLDSFHDQGQIELLLDHCENLSEVHINSEELELRKSMSWWCKNANIRSVTLKDLENDDVLEEMCETLVHLKSFSFNISVTTDKLNHLCRLDHLKQLKIEYFDNEADANISSLLQNLAEKNQLEHLSIMSPFVFEAMARAICNFSRLKELQFECVSSFDQNTINILSEQLDNVEKLTFLDCDEITFEDITKIIIDKLNLKQLTVSGCEHVDVVGRVNYLRLRKQRNLQIFLDAEIFEKTIKLLANDLSDYVKITAVATD